MRGTLFEIWTTRAALTRFGWFSDSCSRWIDSTKHFDVHVRYGAVWQYVGTVIESTCTNTCPAGQVLVQVDMRWCRWTCDAMRRISNDARRARLAVLGPHRRTTPIHNTEVYVWFDQPFAIPHSAFIFVNQLHGPAPLNNFELAALRAGDAKSSVVLY